MELIQSSVILSAFGSNIASYDLDRTVVPINVVFNDETPVMIVSITMTETTKVGTTVLVDTNTPMKVYWALQLKNSPELSYSDINGQISPTYESTQTSYGVAYTDANNIATVTIDGLVAQTEYIFSAVGEDQLGAPSVVNSSQTFETSPRDKASRFTLNFEQDYISVDEVKEIRNKVALVLSLNDWRVVSNGATSSAIPGTRRL